MIDAWIYNGYASFLFLFSSIEHTSYEICNIEEFIFFFVSLIFGNDL
jgi:hypothetical protein